MSFPRHGEVSERFKEHAWKACVGETQPWVQIPPSPPFFSNVIVHSGSLQRKFGNERSNLDGIHGNPSQQPGAVCALGNPCIHRSKVSFDRLLNRSDAINGTVIYVWPELPLLSMGLHCADPCDRPLLTAAARELLAVYHFLGWVPRRQCLHCRGSAAGYTAASRGDPWIRSQVPRSDTRNADFG